MAIGTSPKNAPWLKSGRTAASKYLLKPKFSVWKGDPGIALFIYAQVIEDFGWDMLKRVFTSYETANSSTFPDDSQGKIDLFWSKVSI